MNERGKSGFEGQPDIVKTIDQPCRNARLFHSLQPIREDACSELTYNSREYKLKLNGELFP